MTDRCFRLFSTSHILKDGGSATAINRRARRGKNQRSAHAVVDPKFRRDRSGRQGIDEWDQATGPVNWGGEHGKTKEGMLKTVNYNTHRMVESAELVMKTSEFLGCHEHDVNSLTWPLRGKLATVSKNV